MAFSASHTGRTFQLSRSSKTCQRGDRSISRSSMFVLSNNDLKFDFKAIDYFDRGQNIRWKQIATYKPRGNGISERIVGRIKRSLQKLSQANMLDWDLCLNQVLYGYRRRSTTDVKFSFEMLYGVKSRFSEENEASI